MAQEALRLGAKEQSEPPEAPLLKRPEAQRASLAEGQPSLAGSRPPVALLRVSLWALPPASPLAALPQLLSSE
jgi:hypothetical protein